MKHKHPGLRKYSLKPCVLKSHSHKHGWYFECPLCAREPFGLALRSHVYPTWAEAIQAATHHAQKNHLQQRYALVL